MRGRVVAGIGVIAVAWFAAYAIELGGRMMFNIYFDFGADLPELTLRVRDAMHAYVPWLLAGAATVMIVFLLLRKSAFLLHACATVAATMAVVVSFVVLALVMPLMKCSFQWFPEWGKPAAASGAGSASERPARTTAPSGGCTG